MVLAVLTKLFVVFSIAFVATYLLTPLVARFARNLGFVDTPDLRRVHILPTPLGGGLSVFAGFYFACGYLAWNSALHFSMFPLFFASAFLLMVGIIDDSDGVRPIVKLAAQGMCALVLYMGGFRISVALGIHISLLIDLPITVFWFLAIINSVNLIDGMDGLASGIAAIASLAIAAAFAYSGNTEHAMMFLALSGAALGFLRYNANPASIFLGDTGSMFLGLMLAALPLVRGGTPTPMAAIGIPLLALAIPLIDTVLAVWRRVIRMAVAVLLHRPRASGFMCADMDHVHHRMLRSGMSQLQASYILYLATFLSAGSGMLCVVFPEQTFAILAIAALIGAYVVFRHVAYIELWDSGIALVHCLRYERRPKAARLFYLMIDGALLFLCSGLTVVLLPMQHVQYLEGRWLVALTFYWWLAASLAVFVARKCKQRVEQKNMYAVTYCTLLLVAGAFAGGSLAPEMGNPYLAAFLLSQSAFLFIISFSLLGATRIIPILVENAMLSRLSNQAEAALYGLIWREQRIGVLHIAPPFMPAFHQLLSAVENTVEDQRALLSAVVKPPLMARVESKSFLPEDEPTVAIEIVSQ